MSAATEGERDTEQNIKKRKKKKKGGRLYRVARQARRVGGGGGLSKVASVYIYREKQKSKTQFFFFSPSLFVICVWMKNWGGRGSERATSCVLDAPII